ncbi:hypothetical protein [Listeria booriae]|uniref:hypothetical protein n=1 Tax=Listeria booriae TaxID=1552123 RepID=UPI001E3EB453|nr:hypothetical protein [Listeria booriae]MCD2208582.1 hypothetical protein [Listeria booriae]
MTKLEKITIRVQPDTYEKLKDSRLSYGAEIDRLFRLSNQQTKRVDELTDQVVALQKEKRLLLELSNKMNMVLDVLNTMVASLNVQEFIAHDMSPTEVLQAAILKQEGRVDSMRNY